MPRPVHFEIHATDPEQLVTFYEKVFGWQIQRWGDEPYWMIATGEGPGIDGGLLPRQGPAPEKDAPVGSYINTIDVADLDETIAAVAAEGGSTPVPRQPVPTVGWLAYCQDPDGNVFGILQADPAAR